MSAGSITAKDRRQTKDVGEVHHLPPYSPELDPDEGVNADLKQAVPRKAPARSKPQLKRAAVSHMRSLSKRQLRIRALLRHRQFRYAA